MGGCDFGWMGWRLVEAGESYGEEDGCGEGCGCGPEEVPAGEEGAARGGCDGLREFFGRLGEGDDGAAVRAEGEVGEDWLALVLGQSVLGEGAEYVCVGMLAGLELVGHSVVGTSA
jgi:hypothetical protein